MRSTLRILIFALPALGVGCGEKTHEITEIHERDVPRQLTPWGVTAADRFGMRRSSGAPAGHGGASGAPQFAWDLPAGWRELPTTQLRQANFQPAGNPDVDCYLTVLPGGGGGLVGNVNRWRKQMGLDALPDAEVGALPKGSLFGGEATYLDLEGAYGGMGGQPTREGYRMLGLILDIGSSMATFKLVGPADVVAAEKDAFEAVAASFRLADAHGHGGGQTPPPPSDGGAEPMFQWEAPSSWVRQADRSMRLVTFAPSGSEKTECYVTVLSGDGGGLDANLNRWREQMGLGPLSATDIAALPKVEVLGRPSTLIEVEGAFTGMGGGDAMGDAMLLGLVCELGDRSVYVKMTGPTEEVRREKANFVAFCRSLG